jgi:hypothetical protein
MVTLPFHDDSEGTPAPCYGLTRKLPNLWEARMLSPEERALALHLADKLLELYDRRDEAIDDGNVERVFQVQEEIGRTAAERQELLGSSTERR